MPASPYSTAAKFGRGLALTWVENAIPARFLCGRPVALSGRPYDEKSPVCDLSAFRHCGICAILQHWQQPYLGTDDYPIAESSGARGLCAHVFGTKYSRQRELLFRPGRTTRFRFPAARGHFSRYRRARAEKAARSDEEIQRRLGKPVEHCADVPLTVSQGRLCPRALSPQCLSSCRREKQR
jgi:hypothetical protein